MRLLNANNLQIEDFIGDGVPPYAILSHRWTTDEVTFQDWRDIQGASLKSGFAKIQGTCAQALRDGLEYVWIDTICIDKSSSAELSEAINSMFGWYQQAVLCYVYLLDVPDVAAQLDKDGRLATGDPFCRSQWFTRGWTLQELLAPSAVVFFSTHWKRLGTKTELKVPLSQITGVSADYLTGAEPIWAASVAKRMSWMAKRVTARVEDLAYSMLGIFDINMPLIYGEGTRAFLRLQEEILGCTDDQTIFCWEWNTAYIDDSWASILAPSPAVFANAAHLMPTTWDDEAEVVPYNISNAGLSIKLPLVPTANPHLLFAVLEVRSEWLQGDWGADLPYTHQLCIPLQKGRIYRRLPFPVRPFYLDMAMVTVETHIYVMARARSPEMNRGYSGGHSEQFGFFDLPRFDIGFLLAFASEVPMPQLAYCTHAGSFLERRSLLALSLDVNGSIQDGLFTAGVLRLSLSDGHESFILLAARTIGISGGIRNIRYYCQMLPANSTLGNTVAAIRRTCEDIHQDVDFSTDGVVTVALGNEILYSLGDKGITVRMVQVVYNDADRSDMLRENSDFSMSLCNMVGLISG